MPTIYWIDEATSTSTVVAARADELEHGDAIAAHTQTAGRGQRGNSWEAEPGKNLTFSMLLRPKALPAARQFELSQIVAIAIAQTLRDELATDEVKIKWPNDIYWRDKKICGMLIEHSLTGPAIDRSIAGIGINVNQATFHSDAPNPISMLAIAGREWPLRPLLQKFVDQIVADFDTYEADPDPAALAAKYKSLLWRADGYHPYRDNLTGETIQARIADVSPIGILTLALPNTQTRHYAFKEVTPLL